MFQKRKWFSRKKKFIMVALVASFLLLFRPSIFINGKHKKTSSQSKSNIAIQTNRLVSVSVDNRYLYIAQKVSEKKYKLLYVDQYHPLTLCQEVFSTGLDQQFPPDLRIGYITSIKASPESIFASIDIDDAASCNLP